MNRVRTLIDANRSYENGIRGQGIGVAVLDTGISPHPDFGNRIIGFKDILAGHQKHYDDCSHGTHVCGILGGSGLASRGKYRGIAPECNIVHIKVLDKRGNGNKNDVLRGIAWVLRNRVKYGLRILNISVGTVKESVKRDMQLVEAVEQAWDAGLVVIVAAGNMGPDPMSITVPGNSKKVITVGASDGCNKNVMRGVKHGYSGRGPTAECVFKPDIVAPGSMITSCNFQFENNRTFYTVKSGTSMATPIVSGGIALLLSQQPELSNVEVKMKLRASAVDVGLPKHQQGWGEMNLRRLLQNDF